MKRSTAVVLVLSGAILGGCGRREEPSAAAAKSSQVVTNGTYVEGRGYYHSPFHAWYPYPYNFFSPGLGFYRGGSYFNQPDLRVPPPTMPGRGMNAGRPAAGAAGIDEAGRTTAGAARRDDSAVRRGGFTGGRSWGHSSSS